MAVTASTGSETPTHIFGEVIVVTQGTAVALSTDSQRVKAVTVIAKTANVVSQFLGGSDVTTGTNDGISAGDSLSLPAKNWLDLTDLYVNGGSSEGCDYVAIKA